MSRKPLLILISLLALAALATTGCKKAPPAPPADIETERTVVEPAERTTTAPEPDITDDTPKGIGDLELTEAEEKAYRDGFLGEVYFAYDSSALTSAGRERLSRNAQFLSGDGRVFVVTIEGHCDARGTSDYNIALGERRANAARDYLMSLGVDGSRLRTLSYGEERPTCNVGAESCYSRNRRAYFRLTAKQ